MRVDVTHRAPDDGESVYIVAINDDGAVTHLGVTTRAALHSPRKLVQEAVDRAEEEGHPSAEEYEAWRDFLHWVRFGLDGPLPNPYSKVQCSQCGREEIIDPLREELPDGWTRHVDRGPLCARCGPLVSHLERNRA
jgi:hypothetical protein